MVEENKFKRGEWNGDQWNPSDDDDTDGMPLRPRGAGLSDVDLELLTLAARALGARAEAVDGEQWVNLHFADGTVVYSWNSLDFNGDAFELAVRLRLPLNFSNDEYVEARARDGGVMRDEKLSGDLGDLAAARRAVTRAAAEIGKSMG